MEADPLGSDPAQADAAQSDPAESDAVDRAESIAALMATGAADLAGQVVQTRFRMALAETWGIEPGASVLEIGCGQGDMTAVLADAVGPDGHVLGIDIADPSYGAPVTLGQSAEHLLATDLGRRIEIRFTTDVLTADFPEGAFDCVVLSQCSWYFASYEQLRDTLARVRPWARRLCFSEWDLRPTAVEQTPHLLAVLTQGQIEAAGSRGQGNVRTVFGRDDVYRALAEAGWTVQDSHTVVADGMQDADWEIAACLDYVDDHERMSVLPNDIRRLVVTQADVISATARDRGNAALPVLTIVAE
ncbi:methyltransferase domain-containing protein [Kutzneria sp. NPDC051319]|uniref:class I SAM-dependent methyltransferase n=1 Tax=Kutzneria sp. NPDC051319 TaxID=3155047 RepID=UPI00341766AD